METRWRTSWRVCRASRTVSLLGDVSLRFKQSGNKSLSKTSKTNQFIRLLIHFSLLFISVYSTASMFLLLTSIVHRTIKRSLPLGVESDAQVE